MNGLGSSSFHLQPLVGAEVVETHLLMSVTSISFGVTPIHRHTNPASRTLVETVSASNNGRLPLEWSFAVESVRP
jgi:hypothetical protein